MGLLYPRDMLSKVLDEDTPDGDRETILALADTVFFAGMMLEEGAPVRVAVAHDDGGSAGLAKVLDSSPESTGADYDPEPAWGVTQISRRPFDAPTLAKLSRGLKYGAQFVVVGGTGADLWIDGIARRNPHTDGGPVIRIATPRPGVLVFEAMNWEWLRFDAGQRVTTVDVIRDDCPVRAAIGKITRDPGRGDGYRAPEATLIKLIRSMRETGHGAILAMLPEQPSAAVLERIRYARVDPMAFALLVKADWEKRWALLGARMASHERSLTPAEARDLDAKRAERDSARQSLEEAVADLAQLSAIDGAIVAGPSLAVFGAGYVIQSNAEIRVVKALDAAMTKTEPMPLNYGARHKAGYLFAHDHPGGVAFIVSEDGPVSCALRVGDEVVVWPVRLSET
jgi:hypothetical protein